MKPNFAKILGSIEGGVFAISRFDDPPSATKFHFHTQCQLVYNIEGKGHRVIGNTVEPFSGEEIILLGSNTPHIWSNDKISPGRRNKDKQAISILIFFNPEALTQLLSYFMAEKKLSQALVIAERGLLFKGATKRRLARLMLQIVDQSGLERLKTFIQILDLISITKEYDLLLHKNYINTYQEKDNNRIDKVFKYIFNNFSREIELEEVASLANMSKQSFCRYFKNRTQKTLVQFINEVRIGNACRLLAKGQEQIASLAYHCGYNSLSSFNRFFKQVKGMTPKDYRKLAMTD